LGGIRNPDAESGNRISGAVDGRTTWAAARNRCVFAYKLTREDGLLFADFRIHRGVKSPTSGLTSKVGGVNMVGAFLTVRFCEF